MATLRVVVVDDEAPARERLRDLLQPFPDLEVVGEAENGEEALGVIARLQPDAVFLDIQMPGCSGMEVAASLPPHRPKVVFCTAYDQYALEAFEVHAVDYLLKPVNRVRLARAVERLREQQDRSLEAVLQDSPPARFLARKANRYRVIPREQVQCFVSDGGLTQLWTNDQFYWMDPTLNDLEARLAKAGFFRISRQALINLDHLQEVVPLLGGYGQVRMAGGRTLDVSRRRLKPLMELLQKS